MSKSNTSFAAGEGGTQPRAMVHKKILDIAKSSPDASLERIADQVSGVSATFVERVLKEYGDPAGNGPRTERNEGTGNAGPESSDGVDSQSKPDSVTDGTGERVNQTNDDGPTEKGAPESETTNTPDTGKKEPAANSPEPDTSQSEPVTSPVELNSKQEETLKAVRAEPAATQEEIADRLGVTRATISKRVNDIPGFSWKTRREFVDRLFDDASSERSGSEFGNEGTAIRKEISELNAHIDSLEEGVAANSSGECESVLEAELTHKVVHACMDAEYVSESEELELLRQLL